MPRICIIAFDGTRHDIEAEEGSTVMENAVHNGIPSIDAECGGACACATCHVYVDEAWLGRAGAPNLMEQDMLNFASEVRRGSRLSCQISLTDDLDGLVVHAPERQG
jgi:2Fe-2S ferredoxin